MASRYQPKGTQKVVVDLKKEHVKLLDKAAKAAGLNRTAFLNHWIRITWKSTE